MPRLYRRRRTAHLAPFLHVGPLAVTHRRDDPQIGMGLFFPVGFPKCCCGASAPAMLGCHMLAAFVRGIAPKNGGRKRKPAFPGGRPGGVCGAFCYFQAPYSLVGCGDSPLHARADDATPPAAPTASTHRFSSASVKSTL
jgi:hypothetical protein